MPQPLSKRFGVLGAEKPEGWYSDPEHPDLQRWWDGENWTERRQLPTAPVLVPPSLPTTAKALVDEDETEREPVYNTGEIELLVNGEPEPVSETRTLRRGGLVAGIVIAVAVLGFVAYLIVAAGR